MHGGAEADGAGAARPRSLRPVPLHPAVPAGRPLLGERDLSHPARWGRAIPPLPSLSARRGASGLPEALLPSPSH